MDVKKIEEIKKLSSEISNFETCYEDCKLWGVVDGPVPYEKLLSFLIENPHFQEIASKIEKLNN